MAAPPPPPPPNYPPRPAVWEVPNLQEETQYFIKIPSLDPSIPATFWESLLDHFWFDDAKRGERAEQFDAANWPNWGIAPNLDTIRDNTETFLRRQVRFAGDASWEPSRLLGRGGYGTAGSWLRRNSEGATLDELVVKQSIEDPRWASHHRYQEPGRRHFRGLLNEAVIQTQMNEYNCENILHLRGYAFMTDRHEPTQPQLPPPRVTKGKRKRDDDDDQQRGNRPRVVLPIPENDRSQYRFYLEYAPHRSLHDLIEYYRAWDQLLPEEFLWHVFDSLAAAIEVLKKGPQQMLSAKGKTRQTAKFWPDGYEVLHLDIKPRNVLLGYEDYRDERTETNGGSVVFRYPVVKLADFGLAVITGQDDVNNPLGYEWRGTKNHKPPEQDEYGLNWTIPPNDRLTPFDNAVNVYSIARIVYDCMVLSTGHVADYIMGRNAPDQNSYENNGHHSLGYSLWKTFPLQVSRTRISVLNSVITLYPGPVRLPYSDTLIDLLYDCMRPAAERRISVEELRKRTKAGLAEAERGVNSAAPGRRRRQRPWRRTRADRGPLPTSFNAPHVYVRDNEISNMPQGNTPFPIEPLEYRELVTRMYADPSIPNLVACDPKWQGHRNTFRGWSSRLLLNAPDYYTRVDGRLFFTLPVPQRPAPPPPPPPPPARPAAQDPWAWFRDPAVQAAGGGHGMGPSIYNNPNINMNPFVGNNNNHAAPNNNANPAANNNNNNNPPNAGNNNGAHANNDVGGNAGGGNQQ